ncbi:hypothetical protein DPMN_127944 [Dreissena polymorpha]|uniref:Uncharacterized protein n=1 Tax=Dreissena polymorpha TaxID=45954 RepID=A0A9D4JVA4_DREPO|nr:hypothetical protein DPMN_127944 [Dreissena polymorpha]
MRRKADMALSQKKKVSAASLLASSLSPEAVVQKLQKSKATATVTATTTSLGDSELVEAAVAAESQASATKSAPVVPAKDVPLSTATELRKEVNLASIMKQPGMH